MEFGTALPTVEGIREFAQREATLGFDYLCEAV
jgi:hypothetical protein